MKRFLILLTTISIILLCGCNNKNTSNAVPLTEDIYSPAADKLSNNENVSASLLLESTIKAAGNTYYQTQTGSITYLNNSDDSSLFSKNCDVAFGDYSITLNEIQTKSQHFLTLNGKTFYSASSDTTTHIPIKLLDPENYKNKTIIQDKHTRYLQFTEPTCGEAWALPENATFISASAAVTLNNKNELYQTQYYLQYRKGDVGYSDKYTITYRQEDTPSITLPDPKACVFVEQIYAPLYLEQAYGYLLQITNTNAELTEKINSEVSSLYYEQQIKLQAAENILIDTNILLSDYSRGSESKYTQQETFENGVYAIRKDGSEYEKNPAMDLDAMKKHYQKLLVKNIPSCTYIEGCDLEISNGLMQIEIETGESLAETICQNSCQTIYQDSNFLDSKSSEYEDYTVTYVITIDINNGLPVSSHLNFAGHHTIENIRYKLSTEYIQEYLYPASNETGHSNERPVSLDSCT